MMVLEARQRRPGINVARPRALALLLVAGYLPWLIGTVEIVGTLTRTLAGWLA